MSEQALQNLSGATHAAAACDLNTGKILAIREDIGRHNALDKLIGHIVRRSGLKTSNIFLLLSSRASHELVVKTALAGIGTLVTISAATTMARDLAVKANINLIGFVRGSKQIVYNEAES